MTETIALESAAGPSPRVGRTTVAEAVAQELAALGVDRVFGLPGGEVLYLVDALRREGIAYSVCRHEADAGIAASVYGKLRGTTGVVLTTLGPGAANLMLPLASSWLDREPLLAISAATPETWSADRTHQKLPLLQVYGPVTKRAGAVTPFNCRSLIRNAAASTLAEPLGPALVTLSADQAVAPAEDRSEPAAAQRGGSLAVGSAVETAQQLTRLLATAERPIVVMGLGVRSENAVALRAWLDRWQLPFAVTPKVKGIVDETDARFVGVVGGMAIDSVLRDALATSDLVVGFGLDPVEIDGAWHTTLPMVWPLESAWATGVVPPQGLLAADHAELLAELACDPPREWDADSFEEARRARADVYANHAGSNGCLSPVAAVRALAGVMPPETIVATDVGSHKYVVGQFWPSRFPETFFMSNGLSGMGYGLPAAIGAKLARPESPVLAVVGDGGFSMNSQELETARRLGAPFVTVVLADRCYSLIRIGQENRGLERYGVDFDPIDSVGTAEACGIEGVRATSEDELAARVSEAVAARSPLVVEVPIDSADYRGIV
jgi:acetolactate synthase-1/2/3 large subunit